MINSGSTAGQPENSSNGSTAGDNRRVVNDVVPGAMVALIGRGEVYSFTTMYNVPKGFDDQKPYTIALVKLDDGPMVTAQLTDVAPDDVSIGLRVEMVTRKLREEGSEGQIIYGYKFRPLFMGRE